MCGIAGIWSRKQDRNHKMTRLLAMTDGMHHRGPDSSGTWESDDTFMLLGHRRLAIQDLSALGHQPMQSRHYTISFNGEIYNFNELRVELIGKGFTFAGHSDTEVILAAVEHWGFKTALSRLRGMFAIALYDTTKKELWLARDRMGEKPLYFFAESGEIYFASELTSLLKGVNRALEIDWPAMDQYFRFGYFSPENTPFTQIKKLPPASTICLKGAEDLFSEYIKENIERYWFPTSDESLEELDYSTGSERIEELLFDSIKSQSIADVNVGVFLSGGIDSSLVAAILQNQSSKQINTFTVAFDDKRYNEAAFAKQVAGHIGSNHTEINLSSDACLNTISKLPDLLDEPFADSSILPTFLVSEAAKKYATVCLSGDGGDEIFAGYNRYLWGAKVANINAKTPHSLRKIAAATLASVPLSVYDNVHAKLSSSSGRKKAEKDLGSKVHKLARSLDSRDNVALYLELLSLWKTSPLTAGKPYTNNLSMQINKSSFESDFIKAASEFDMEFYLPCNNLFKVDRAAMATSLEVRLPLLDHRIVSMASRISTSQKIMNGESKSILRSILYKYVPKSLLERPKMGFSVPLAGWLRSELNPWATGLLEQKDLMDFAGINRLRVERAWQEHQTKKRDNSHALWAILMSLHWFQLNSNFIKAS